MKIPKCLQRLADEKQLRVEPVRYNAHGRTWHGFALVDREDNELAEIEPYSRPKSAIYDAIAWKITRYYAENSRIVYARTIITGVKQLSDIPQLQHTGYKFKNKTTA